MSDLQKTEKNELNELKKENSDLKNVIKDSENKYNILKGENIILRQLINEKEQLVSKFQNYYLEAKSKIIFLLEENKKLINENKKLKDELEDSQMERNEEKKSQIKEMKNKVNNLKKEISRINTFYGTQIIEKNAKIKNLEDNNIKLEDQLIQTISLNLIGENKYNTIMTEDNNNNHNIYRPNHLSQNIYSNYTRTQCLSSNKKNNTQYKRVNNTNDLETFLDKKFAMSIDKESKSTLDSNYYINKLMKNNKSEKKKKIFNNQTSRGNSINDYTNHLKEKIYSPIPIDNKKRINDKFQNFISKFGSI
jgi:hypothetical protein